MQMSVTDPTTYEQGWFDAIGRIWELAGSLELKYPDEASKAILAEFATMLLENKQPPTATGERENLS
jgi:hypothetical protein